MKPKFLIGVIAGVLGLTVCAWFISLFSSSRYAIGVLVVMFFSGLALATARLNFLNRKRQALLQENYQVGKLLVRRDMELSEANSRLIELDQSKSEFVSIAAHQLRTPLTGIRWSFDALLDRAQGDLSIDQLKIAQAGLKSSVRMIELVNDLLNVARIEEGKFGLHTKTQDVGKVIGTVADEELRPAESKGVELILDISPDLPFAEIDEEKLGIALQNLVDNAVKYTPPGGKVTVSAVADGPGVKLIVADTGIGVPKEQVDQIFSKFFRADNALRFQTAGNGLGLYVVKNVVESHGGKINIESIENKGTTITVTLPLKNPKTSKQTI